MITHTIYTGQADGWHLVISARAALGRWALKFSFNSASNRRELKHTSWLDGVGWKNTEWRPPLGSEARAIAEAWLQAHPVPAPGAGVKP